MQIIGFLLIGFAAGWLAGLLMRGRGFGCFGNVLVGGVGAVIGGFLFQILGLRFAGVVGSLLTALVGALVLLFVVGILSKSSR